MSVKIYEEIEISDEMFEKFGNELYTIEEIFRISIELYYSFRYIDYLYYKIQQFIMIRINISNYSLVKLNEIYNRGELIELFKLKGELNLK